MQSCPLFWLSKEFTKLLLGMQGSLSFSHSFFFCLNSLVEVKVTGPELQVLLKTGIGVLEDTESRIFITR